MQHMNECGIENKDLDIEVLNCVMKGGFQLSVIGHCCEALFVRSGLQGIVSEARLARM